MIKTITVESVTSGHPDKLADLIADTILDECLNQDKNSRVACEVLLCGNHVNLAGEITTKANVNYLGIAKNVIESVGYDTKDLLFYSYIHEQSDDIAQAVFNDVEQGAGDQGVVYGYAVNETYNFMPLSTNIANSITMCLEDCKKSGAIKGLMPDGKVQVSLEYKDGVFNKIKTLIISVQHTEETNINDLRADIYNMLSNTLHFVDLSKTDVLINPSGRFVLGGFEADTGLTGRKLAVDTYGGLAHNGGGALSGKDSSKVDRSAAYMARYIAKNIVAAGVADGCEISIAYAIGKPQPVAVDVMLLGQAKVDADKVKLYILNNFDLSPSAIINTLQLKQPIYAKTAVGGHFGIDDRPWEQLDKIMEIRTMLL